MSSQSHRHPDRRQNKSHTQASLVTPGELAALPLFASASPDIVDAIARRAVAIRFDAGATLFLAGTVPRGWFIVLDGEVRVVRVTDGRQHVVHTERAGGTLAEVPLIEGGTLPATAIATTATRCALLTPDALENAIREQPRVAFYVARQLAARVRALVDRLDERSARTVDSRLAELLLSRLSARDPGIIDVGLTQQALAEELGTVREVVARALRTLVRRGVIERRGARRYFVVNRESLTAMV